MQLCKAHETGVLSQPEAPWGAASLPATFLSSAVLYSSMKQMVLDEAMSMVRSGLRSHDRQKPLRLRLNDALRAADRGARLGGLSVTAVGASTSECANMLRAGSVLCLSIGSTHILAVVDGRSQDGVGSCLLEVASSALERAASLLREGSVWIARCVASVLLQQRCADACLRQPGVPFMHQLLGGRASSHVRFDGDGEPTDADATGPTASTSIEAADETDAAGLNESQRNVVTALGASNQGGIDPEIILLQGPPGTGKTTTLVQVLRVLTSRPEVARLLVCAPSNRGVQELLERLLVAVAARDGGEGSEDDGVIDPDADMEDSSGGQDAPADEGWRWCCKTGRWIGPACHSSADNRICEDDVVLVGDADKVPHGSVSSRVFVHRIEGQWATELTDAAASLRDTASRIDAAAPQGQRASALATVLSPSLGPFTFCSHADLACSVRINHIEDCAASRTALLRAVCSAAEAAARVGRGVRRRLRQTLVQYRGKHGSALEDGLKESKHLLRLAAVELDAAGSGSGSAVGGDGDGGDGDGGGGWPCTLEARASRLKRLMCGAAGALDAACRGLAELCEVTRQEDRAAEMLSSARCVFCTLAVAGCYLVRAMPPVDFLVVDEAAQATEPCAPPNPNRPHRHL